MKKKLLYSLLFGMFAMPSMFAADYGLPAGIQEGNILHCFNWKLSDIKAELPNIAAAGFGSVQVSPLQRNVAVGENWSAAYRPYDFKFIASAGLGSAEDLKSLCQEAEKYGIKIIVDVVENHVDGYAAGDRTAYHDPWWNSNGRLRWYGSVNNWGDRGQITTHQMGGGDGYPDVNSEDSEVAARGKAYIQELKDMGVKGIRFDAAKHIGLPSEGCQFWATVTSVPGLYYYGEILDGPGGNGDALMKEYTQYIAVTDNNYGDQATKNNGIPNGHAGWCAGTISATKTVYWGESHDTYANDNGFSKNLSQDQVDRGYAIVACRNGETALYLSRPSAKNFNDIKIGAKGSTAYKNTHIAEVNKFRNVMVGKADYYSGGNGVASVTRKDGGAVIVANGGNRNISVANGGGYCPAGTYTDRVSGGTFTVTESTISGNVGSSGIAVIYNDGITPNPNPNPNPGPDPVPSGSMWILGNIDGHQWTTNAGAAMTLTDGKYVANGVKLSAATGATTCYFNITDALGADWDELNMTANRYGAATEGAAITLGTPATVVKYANNVDASNCKSWTIAAGTYDFTFDPSAMTITVVNAGDNPNPTPNPNPQPDPTPGTLTITGDYNLAYSGDKANVHYWGGSAPSTWPGVPMTTVTGSDGNTYKVAKIDASSTGLLFNTNGDKNKTGDLTYKAGYVMNDTGATSTAVTFTGGNNPNPNPDPVPTPGDDYYIYFDDMSKSDVAVWAWGENDVNCTASGEWPGDKMTIKDGKYYWTLPEGKTVPTNIIISWGSHEDADKAGGKDLVFVNKATYHADGTYTENGDPVPVKPVVTASPASGTSFSETLNVTLTVAPAADIYYTLDGSAATTSSTKYTAPISLSATTTIKTLAVTADGAQNAQTFTYTKSSTPTPPNPGPTPAGNNLITDYFKVNPNGQSGSNRTVNMSFSEQKSTTALSNWTEADLIAQGVARDCCQAFKGVHERPIVDSYALYAAYDSQNLYLGVQYVYTVWDLYGEGKQPGESKPYNMDGKLCFAFDLDPAKSAKGITNEDTSIWQDGIYTTFDNGADAWWYGSTKPGVGTPGLFVPNAAGICDYKDPNSCKPSTVKYGYADGLLPHITAVYGQDDFSYDPELLKGNNGFKNLRQDIEDTAHTFYEYTFPLSMLGITEDYIKNEGIGVMVVDFYGSSAHSSLPYDPCFYDHVFDAYSQDDSSSAEKEDKNEVTYSMARIGKYSVPTGIEVPVADEAAMDAEPQYFTLQGVRVENPSNGIFIVVRGNKVTKEAIR